MSTNLKILISAVGVAALLATPAVAKTRAHHHAAPRAAYAAGRIQAAPASPYSGIYYNKILPYNEMIVTNPDGRYAGTDPDPRIRADMRRGGGGTNSANGTTSPGN
jgi:hypothetical protein